MVDPVSISASIIASSTAKHLYGKGKRMHFLNEAVENAASHVAESHEGLDADVFIAIFEDDHVVDLVEEFDDGGDLITPSDIAESFNEDMLGEEVEATPEDLVNEFLNQLEVEISKNQELGHKLIMDYSQRIHQHTEDLEEGQTEILLEIQRIAGRLPTGKKYRVFQPIPERFRERLNGEHPHDRYDLPFFGRENELDKITDFPNSGEDVLILAGRAGIGKTRLVVEGSLLLEAEKTDWQVYWTDIHAGNIDDGLEELELEDERNTLLFVDDARNADQIKRLFDLAEQYQPHLKLIFTERPHFISSLQDYGNRFSDVETETVELQPLNTEDVHEILREYYGVTHPATLDQIVSISEGLPLFAHLLAEQFSGDEHTSDPVAQDESLEAVFEDVLSDIQKLGEQQGVGNPQKLETYVKYLSAIGELDTNNEDLLQQFREAISVDRPTEIELREILTENIGLVAEHSNRLTVQPDALQEYIVYNSFFSDSPRDYQGEIYDNFSEFTGKNQINQLAIIHRRYNCREARKTIRDALNTEIENIGEYGFAKRVRLLRRFKILASTHPHYAIELVKAAHREELPEDPEEEQLFRSSMYTASPAGDLIIESTDLLSNALQGEPEDATWWLLWIAVNYPPQSQLQTGSADQKLRQALRPGFNKSPGAQQKILGVVGEHFLSGDLDDELRLDLLDVIGEVSSTEIHDFSVDPINRSQMRSWQGKVPVTEPWLELREQAVALLIEIIQEDPHPEIRKTAAEKLGSFENSQARYYGEHQEVFNQEELARVLEFAAEYVSENEDLQCIDALSRLAERDNADELGIEEETQGLQEELEDNERYQLLQQMRRGGPKKMEEWEAEIRSFAEGIDEEELEPGDFKDIVAGIRDSSFNRFFMILADERPDFGEQLLEADDPDLTPCKPHVLMGICSADPEKGKDFVNQYIEKERFGLAPAGLRSLATEDLDYVQEKIEELLENQSPYSPELISGLSQVLNGYWEDHQEWTESVLSTLLHDAESLDSQSVEMVLRPLPLHNDDSENVDGEILEEVLDYTEKRENLTSEPHSLQLVIAEIAERNPEQFVNFTLQRLENEYTGVSLLPTHLDVETDRMKEADSYDAAVNEVCQRILDTDYYTPMAFSDLTACFPIADIAERLVARIPDCSEDQLLQVIWYCKFLPVTENTEKIYRKVVTEGVDDIRDAESVSSVIHGALYTDALATRSLSEVSKKEDEIEMLRDWQEDSSLPSSVRLFAEEAEDHLLDSVERQEKMF
ncbi:ATP-binding protein [Natronobeatus ordinarius]|uniref:ATP-binding protein n=1 Tax=Natronobeatus ordinarius TaxID=2963433 RepID=UPI0020CF86E3|nr:ATP-binding protein [Natronobeatus ordinarius]